RTHLKRSRSLFLKGHAVPKRAHPRPLREPDVRDGLGVVRRPRPSLDVRSSGLSPVPLARLVLAHYWRIPGRCGANKRYFAYSRSCTRVRTRVEGPLQTGTDKPKRVHRSPNGSAVIRLRLAVAWSTHFYNFWEQLIQRVTIREGSARLSTGPALSRELASARTVHARVLGRARPFDPGSFRVR
ncbi:MAG: hypothetical protein ACI9OJ_000876, partial [Myxococcota bacterium]